jgi:2,3-bisphosphoglycerate-dependent phosphoglycerate mutase
MIRHGESSWNVEKRFTGWCDVPLTTHGEIDAHDAGVLMGERGMKFDVAFTSTLERAWRTCAIALSAAGQSGSVETIRSWKLNERHYGALQGHLKDSPKLTKLFGEEKILEWRRSYDTAPPSLYDPKFSASMGPESYKRATDMMNPLFLDPRFTPKPLNPPTFNAAPESDDFLNFEGVHKFPSTESLKNCEDRAFGYWNEVIAPRVKAGERVLIVAHANTIRALVKAVDQVSQSTALFCPVRNQLIHFALDDNSSIQYSFSCPNTKPLLLLKSYHISIKSTQ